MKAIIILMTLIFSAFGLQNNAITVKHKFYTTTFDTVKNYPILVQWWVTKKALMCDAKLIRLELFTEDPSLERYTRLGNYYKGSGYDRGHNMPAADNECDKKGLEECFYYSNMTPQSPRLNRGDWKDLEEYTRDTTMKYDSIKVWCGSIGEIKKLGKVSVPEYCWKVLFIKKLIKYQAFIFPNSLTNPNKPLKSYSITLNSLYKLTGIKIK